MQVHEWKVRSMRTADSQAAVAAAERAKVTTAVWLGRAIREAIEREHGALEGDLEVPEWRSGGERFVGTASPVANPQVTLDQLVTIAALKDVPRWLRTGAHRHIASTIQVDVPARRVRRAPHGDGGDFTSPPSLPGSDGLQAASQPAERVHEGAGGAPRRKKGGGGEEGL